MAALTVEDFERLPPSLQRWEMVNGELVEVLPLGPRHGACAMRLAVRLGAHIYEAGLGELFNSTTGFVFSEEPASVRVADLAYVSADRLACLDDRDRLARIGPDLAIEVVSPRDSFSAVMTRRGMWLMAGAVLVWIVDPASRSVFAYSVSEGRAFNFDDDLDGLPVLSDFRMPVAEIFAF